MMAKGRVRTAETPGETVAPAPAAMFDSMRSLGYSPNAAIADLIDNSISAGASTVEIHLEWNGTDSRILIVDNGCGMTARELVAAMRPGTTNPGEPRAGTDLGRFGLGLKTAAVSQGKRLVVWSKRASTAAIRCWDLDHVAATNKWQLLRPQRIEVEEAILPGRGTVVLLEKLDRLVAETDRDNPRDHDRFLERIDEIRDHLAAVFHRYIADGRVTIRINSQIVRPWDPFLTSLPATQSLPETNISFRGGKVTVRPYILPHQSKLSQEVYQIAAGSRGWNAQQGFYVYRNQRLLLAGDWLGLGWKKEAHYNLARIQLDFGSEFDADWSIDVMKSRATLPTAIRDKLRQIGETTRLAAKRVYSHRGVSMVGRDPSKPIVIWKQFSKRGRLLYKINRSHPLIEAVQKAGIPPTLLEPLLLLIENSLPVGQILPDAPAGHGQQTAPAGHDTEGTIRELLVQIHSLFHGLGHSSAQIGSVLANMIPFRDHPAILQEFMATVHERNP